MLADKHGLRLWRFRSWYKRRRRPAGRDRTQSGKTTAICDSCCEYLALRIIAVALRENYSVLERCVAKELSDKGQIGSDEGLKDTAALRLFAART